VFSCAHIGRPPNELRVVAIADGDPSEKHFIAPKRWLRRALWISVAG
jgi:hypothetical protein